MEYFVNHDLLSNLERLSNQDRPHGIKCKSLQKIVSLCKQGTDQKRRS